MTLKEKLAKQYYIERPDGFGEPTNDFIAGFEKARECIIQAVKESDTDYWDEGLIERVGEEDA